MQRQLEFWPVAEKTPCDQGQWETLRVEEQAERIVQLARLIAKAVCPQAVDEIQENSHEQQ